jgi:hypothetical protein
MPKHHRMRQIGGHKPPQMIPRWLRPKLTPSSLIDLGLAHHQNVDAVARGEGNEEILWQMVGGCLTWSRIADVLGLGVPEMTAQVLLVNDLIERYGRTGRVLFTGTEYQLAKDGAFVMDELACKVDAHTALLAATWSEERTNRMAEENRGKQHAEGANA